MKPAVFTDDLTLWGTRKRKCKSYWYLERGSIEYDIKLIIKMWIYDYDSRNMYALWGLSLGCEKMNRVKNFKRLTGRTADVSNFSSILENMEEMTE